MFTLEHTSINEFQNDITTLARSSTKTLSYMQDGLFYKNKLTELRCLLFLQKKATSQMFDKFLKVPLASLSITA